MLPLFKTFKKEILDREVDVLDISSIQTSVITKYFPELGTFKNWEVAVQSSIPINKNDPSEGFIILDRTFQDLKFDSNAYDFDFIKGNNIKDPFYTPTQTEATIQKSNSEYISSINYWKVIQCLTVKEWFSSNTKELENFECWEYKEHIYQQEIYFKHKLIHTEIWNRPTIAGITKSLFSGSGNPTDAVKVCDIGAGETEPTFEDGIKIDTGISKTFEKGESCLRWDSLEVPFRITFNVKKALGAVIKIGNTSINTKVYLKDSAVSENKIEVSSSYKDSNNNWGSFNNPILLTEQFIEIEVEDPYKNSLTKIEINYYGEEWYRVPIPFKWDEEVDYINHTEETILNSPDGKYHPPQTNINNTTYPNFPIDFRVNKEYIELKNFNSRITQEF